MSSDGQHNLIGQNFGNFRLPKLLGQGGFGDVYLGEHIYLETQAAIKVLRVHLSEDEIDSFLNEARIVARLVHPHIVRVLDFGVEGNTPFLVMDYAPNGTLRQLHPRGMQVPLPTVVSYTKQVAGALEYAHEHGVIHLDVKPENMLLGPNEEVWLSDFGIAKKHKHTPNSSSAEPNNSEDLFCVGTPEYTAPERFNGKERRASDQYSLGIVVYEWLCGHPPFQGTPAELETAHASKAPPSFRQQNATVPQAVERVVMKALAKKPEDRYESVQKFAKALEQAESLSDVLFTRRQALTSIKVIAAGLVVATAVGFTAEVFLHAQPPLSPVIAPSPTLLAYRHPAGVSAIAWSPNGLIASGDHNGEIHVWDIHGNTLTKYREHHDQITGISFFADGERISSISLDGTLRMWYARTGQHVYTQPGNKPLRPYQTSTSPFSMFTVAWSPRQEGNPPTSEHLALNIGSQVLIFDSPIQFGYDQRGQDPTYIGHSDNVYSVAWLPDPAKKIVASASADRTVQVWDVYTGKQLVYAGHSDDVLTVAWSPDGKLIASGGDDMTLQVWDATTGTLYFKQEKLPGAVKAAAWLPSKQGRYIAWATANGSVEVWDVDGNRQIRNYPGHSSSVNALATSPNSSMIASGGDDKTVQVWLAGALK